MEPFRYGLMLRVNDLDHCRIFYRDLLGLGEPVFDSPFLITFLLDNRLMLTLEKSAAEYLEHASSAACFYFSVPDLEAFARKLDENGFPLEEKLFRIGVADFRRGTDPEGNIFLVCQAT